MRCKSTCIITILYFCRARCVITLLTGVIKIFTLTVYLACTMYVTTKQTTGGTSVDRRAVTMYIIHVVRLHDISDGNQTYLN